MDQHELFEQANDQELTAHNLMTFTQMTGDDPPVMKLILDVTHDETGLAWRQSVTFNGNKMRELTELMVYSCNQIGIEWSEQNGSSEEI